MPVTEQDVPTQVLCCYAPDLRPLAILLSTVHFSARANIQIAQTGIHVQVEIGKTLQAHAYLEKVAFTDWDFNPPVSATQLHTGQPLASVNSETGSPRDGPEENTECKFEVSMTALIECLNVFGTATSQRAQTKKFQPQHSEPDEEQADGRQPRVWEDRRKIRKQPTSALRISYDGEGHPLVLLIEDSGVVTRCALVTYEAEELADMDFPVDRQVVHLIMKSDWLKSAFAQFDDKTASEITFMFSPPGPRRKHKRFPSSSDAGQPALAHPTFRIEVDGDMGCWTIDFPNDKDILESFECKLPADLDAEGLEQVGFVRNSYKLSHILKVKKALDVSSKASLRVDDAGFLSLQLLIPLEESTTMRTKKGYVEFLCVPIEDG